MENITLHCRLDAMIMLCIDHDYYDIVKMCCSKHCNNFPMLQTALLGTRVLTGDAAVSAHTLLCVTQQKGASFG